MKTAYEQGLEWGSCNPALEMRKAYATQSAWWKGCKNPFWHFWQLRHLPDATLIKLIPQLKTIFRAMRSALAALDVLDELPMLDALDVLAALDVQAMWSMLDERAMRSMLDALAALDVLDNLTAIIHREIPEWPGEEE